jgi:pimeloyl-ACP methyl ester carboxylesterase
LLKTLPYKNIDVAFHDSGKGSVVVLLHGFLENAGMWQPLVPSLEKKYRVIAIDLLGHGQTPPLGYVQTMEDQADMVHAVLHELRIRKAVLAGHSMGGYVALAFAEMFPEMIKGLALINSTSRADSNERKANRDRAIVAVKQNCCAFVSMSIANLFSKENREKFSAEIEAVKKEAMKTPLQGIVASLEGMKIRKDREVLMHFGPYPIVLMLGRKDPVLPYEENATQVAGTKTLLVSLPDGHMGPIENQSGVEKELLDFIRSI